MTTTLGLAHASTSDPHRATLTACPPFGPRPSICFLTEAGGGGAGLLWPRALWGDGRSRPSAGPGLSLQAPPWKEKLLLTVART